MNQSINNIANLTILFIVTFFYSLNTYAEKREFKIVDEYRNGENVFYKVECDNSENILTKVINNELQIESPLICPNFTSKLKGKGLIKSINEACNCIN